MNQARTPDSVAELAAAWKARHPVVGTVFLRFADTRVAVHSNSEALLKALSTYYRDFPGEPAAPGEAGIEVTALECPAPDLGLAYKPKPLEPGKKKVKEEFVDLADGRVVRKRLTGLVFLFGGGENLAVGPCLENDNQIVNFINNRHIERLIKGGCLLFHASGVALGNRGISMAGFAGMGKSTLSLAVMRHGTDFVSNDRIMVERAPDGGPETLRMHGLAKMPRVNPGTVLNNDALAPVIPAAERSRFEALPAAELWDLEHKYDAFIDECFGPGKFRLSCPLSALVLLNWTRTDDPLRIARIDLRRRPDLMPAFMKELGLFFEMDRDASLRDFSADAYLAVLDGCPVYEFSGGVDFEAAAEACMDILRG